MGSVHARGDTFLTFGLKARTETNTWRLATALRWPYSDIHQCMPRLISGCRLLTHIETPWDNNPRLLCGMYVLFSSICHGAVYPKFFMFSSLTPVSCPIGTEGPLPLALVFWSKLWLISLTSFQLIIVIFCYILLNMQFLKLTRVIE
jgi:hypothetical protein